MSETQDISVVLPVFNAAQYLPSAIESILNQTYPNFELILIDDGSTDDSLSVIRRYQERDERVRVISRENRGLISSLNEGVDQAKGTFIARMDADDISLPERFKSQIEFMKSHTECVALGTRAMLMDPDGLDICPFLDVQAHEQIDAFHMDMQGGAIVHPSAMIRRAALLKVGGYRQEFLHAEDIDLFLRLAETGQLANLPEVLIRYRQHFNSIGYRHRKKQLTSARQAVDAACKRRSVHCDFRTQENPNIQISSLQDNYLRWVWWSLSGGNPRTARKYALKALAAAPLTPEAWKALACSIRGY
jgi:glycosyltransferase involved in cell wall biosynthesis